VPETVERVVFVEVSDPLCEFRRPAKIAPEFLFRLVQQERQVVLRHRKRFLL